MFAAYSDQALQEKGRREGPATDLVAQVGFTFDDAMLGEAHNKISIGHAAPLELGLEDALGVL
ncbi:MAG TPA: hypothetical protein PLH31_13115 [Caulobacter sp.]|nr:hypothetical protein [Caulobacter sp.]